MIDNTTNPPASAEPERGATDGTQFYRCDHGIAPFACTCGRSIIVKCTDEWHIATGTSATICVCGKVMAAASPPPEMPLFCPECDHQTAANGMCFRCHPIEGASPPYEAHPCEYRNTRRHSPWCPWASRNDAARRAAAGGEHG